MKRNVDMNEISDGNLYELNDMVKADCNDCEGCSACCKGMGQSILLDPLDIYRLTLGLKMTFEELLCEAVELRMADGVILPNMKMNERTDACFFLNEEGRCSIHSLRPGICRLFPLGRFYENHDFKYFLQIHECKKPNKSKIKVKKWIDTLDVQKNHKYIVDWHYFIDDVQNRMQCLEEDKIKKIDLFLLQHFFIEKYSDEQDFYEQFDVRLNKAKTVIDTLTKV